VKRRERQRARADAKAFRDVTKNRRGILHEVALRWYDWPRLSTPGLYWSADFNLPFVARSDP
jgi:hypothetical protein